MRSIIALVFALLVLGSAQPPNQVPHTPQANTPAGSAAGWTAPAPGETAPDAPGIDATATSAWAHPTPAIEGHEHRQRGEGRLGLGIGVLLVVFGSIALVGSALPGWVAGLALGPAFLVALGIAFVVMAIRRPTTEP